MPAVCPEYLSCVHENYEIEGEKVVPTQSLSPLPKNKILFNLALKKVFYLLPKLILGATQKAASGVLKCAGAGVLF